MSSRGTTVRALHQSLRIRTSLRVGKATNGKTGKGGLVVSVRPSLLFLSVRLPSVRKVHLLDRVHRRIL